MTLIRNTERTLWVLIILLALLWLAWVLERWNAAAHDPRKLIFSGCTKTGFHLICNDHGKGIYAND